MALDAKWMIDTMGSTTSPITTAVASNKFYGAYISDSATSGVAVGHYVRLYVTGAGGGGCVGRFYCDLAGTAASGGSGIQATCGTGESTSAGSVSGLGTGVYAQVGIANATLTGGTYAAVNAEVYTWGSSSVITNCDVSLIRLSNQGAGATNIDATANIFEIAGFTSGAGAAYYEKGSSVSGTMQGSLKVKCPAGIRYIPLYVTLT